MIAILLFLSMRQLTLVLEGESLQDYPIFSGVLRVYSQRGKQFRNKKLKETKNGF